MELTYKYRLYPTREQSEKILNTCGAARYLYNRLLSKRTRQYRKTMEWEKLDAQSVIQETPFLAEVDASALRWAINDLKRAYSNFFHIERTQLDRYRPESIFKSQCDEHYALMDNDLVGYPQLKRKKATRQSYTTTSAEIHLPENRVILAGIGSVKVRLHRMLPDDAEIMSYTVIKKPSGNYFLLVRLKVPDVEKRKDLHAPLGMAFVPGKLIVRSDGTPVCFYAEDPHLRRQIEKAYQTLCRRKPGSKRWEKQREYMASLYEKRTNQRRDSLHKIACQIANDGDCLFMEKPEVRRKMRRYVSEQIQHEIWDEAWWTFSQMVKQKTEMKGNVFWTVVEAYPIRTICSECNSRSRKGLNGDRWVCPHCGVKLYSEDNAAKNLRNLAEKHIKDLQEISESEI